MVIKRNKGIFDIKLDISKATVKKDEQIRSDYNALCFLINCIIPIIDRLEENSTWRHNLKKLGNNFRSEIIKLSDEHGNTFINHGAIDKPEGGTIDAQDIYKITNIAYDKALEWFTTRKPNHIVSLITSIEKLEENDNNFLDNVLTEYKPIKQ